jgi:GH25 family lysozyme M1 (1,4-beta-N-acetylmuramidase)
MTTRAIDVSSWQHPGGAGIDFNKVKASGVDGVWIKCTQGTTYVNPFFKGDYDGAKAAGLVVGAFHFATPSVNSAEAEAAHALATCAGLDLELGLALDMEQLGTVAPHDAGPWCESWLSQVAAQHVLAPFYTDQSLLSQIIGAPWGYPLWIADPSGTFQGTWWAKQTGSGPVDGVPNACDQDEIANVRGINPTPPNGPTTAPPVESTPPAPPVTTNQPAPPTIGGLIDVNVPTLSVTDPGPGAVSEAVKALQVLLVDKWGCDLSPSGIDGRFGPQTENGVRWVQGESQGRAGAVDGIVGPETWSFLVVGGK